MYQLIDSFQAGAALPGNQLTLRNQALHWPGPDGDGEYYRWDGQLPKMVLPGSTPESTGEVKPGAWVGVGDAALRTDLALQGGAEMIGVKTPDGSQSTVQDYLDEINVNISKIEEDINYINDDVNKVFSSSDPDKQYASFCDSCLALGKEFFINRVSSSHVSEDGGVSSLYILQKENGKLVSKYIIPPVAGYDHRDPSITWEPVTRRLVVTSQMYDVANDVFNGGNVYIFSSSVELLKTAIIGANGYFQWGKALRTPSGHMLVSAYSINNSGVNIYTSAGTFDDPGSFSLTKTIFSNDPSLSRSEVSLHFWKEFLVAVARTQDTATQSLQNASVSYTRDLTGSAGWSVPQRIAITGVAPRMTTMNDGALCLTFGSIAKGYRGSVAAVITYDLVTFGTANTIFFGGSGDGGYHGITLSKDGLSVYTYVESEHLIKASTYLEYIDSSVVQMMSKPSVAPLSFFSQENVTYIGGQPFGTDLGAAGGYVTIFVKTAINNCKGILLNLGGNMLSPQYLLLEKPDGTLYATMGSVDVTSTGTYLSSISNLNIPSGLYRITVPTASIATGKRVHSGVDTFPDDRVYGLVDVSGSAANSDTDVFIGFVV